MLKLKDVARCVLLAVCDLSGDQHFGPVGFVLCCDFLCWFIVWDSALMSLAPVA